MLTWFFNTSRNSFSRNSPEVFSGVPPENYLEFHKDFHLRLFKKFLKRFFLIKTFWDCAPKTAKPKNRQELLGFVQMFFFWDYSKSSVGYAYENYTTVRSLIPARNSTTKSCRSSFWECFKKSFWKFSKSSLWIPFWNIPELLSRNPTEVSCGILQLLLELCHKFFLGFLQIYFFSKFITSFFWVQTVCFGILSEILRALRTEDCKGKKKIKYFYESLRSFQGLLHELCRISLWNSSNNSFLYSSKKFSWLSFRTKNSLWELFRNSF